MPPAGIGSGRAGFIAPTHIKHSSKARPAPTARRHPCARKGSRLTAWGDYMKYRLCLLCSLLAGALASLGSSRSSAAAPAPVSQRPKLVLQVTVDQLRGDMVTRYADRWGTGGFRRLLEGGTHYANTHYDHSTTFTAVGHATLFTGGGPAQHGIAGNDWFDTRSRRHVYSVEDSWHTLLGAKAQKPHEGSSPRNLTSTTIGDEMITASAGRAKVFGVSLKDRGAVIAGGLRGKSFWYDKDTGRFVTSTYYYSEYPQWVRSFNDARPADAWLG